jgi:hypothetical protein
MRPEHESFEYDTSAFAGELSAAPGNRVVGSRLLFENDRLRVWDITLAPGERLPFHRHVTTYFYRGHSDGLLHVRFPDGSGAVYPAATDEVHFHEIGSDELVVHDLENAGETTVRFTTVELLR